MESFKTNYLVVTLDENNAAEISVSENFTPEDPSFLNLAENLANDYLQYQHRSDINFTTLEKLEILYKKTREIIGETAKYYDHYTQEYIIFQNEKFSFEAPNTGLYDKIRMLNNDLAKVTDGGKCGVVTSKGENILPIEYDEVYLLSEKFLKTHKNGAEQVFHLDGEPILTEYDEVIENYNPFGVDPYFFWVKSKGKWGLFDENFKRIIPFKLEYDKCELLRYTGENDVYIKVFKDNKCGVISGLLKVDVIPLNEDFENIFFRRKKFFVFKKDKTTQEMDVPSYGLSSTE